jgi:hypothetical protein
VVERDTQYYFSLPKLVKTCVVACISYPGNIWGVYEKMYILLLDEMFCISLLGPFSSVMFNLLFLY